MLLHIIKKLKYHNTHNSLFKLTCYSQYIPVFLLPKAFSNLDDKCVDIRL